VIGQQGWAIEYIGGGVCSAPGYSAEEDDGPPFAYTVGLIGLGHPELLVFGLGPHDSQGLLNTVGERIRNGDVLIPGQMLTFDEWGHLVIPEEVPNPGEIVFTANRFYQRPSQYSVPVLQLTYDDMTGRFPWEPEYSVPSLQPIPGAFRA